jgi:predicted adenylyl cyclase CyaB
MRNLEFKARLEDGKAVLAKARSIGAELWGDMRQTDTYFDVGRGRLKLRDMPGFQAQLVYYERDEESDSRPSEYFVTPMADPVGALELLGHALGVRAVVHKKRTLVLLDTTRIHFDNVEGLGQFLEIEVPAAGDEQAARERLDSLITGLGYTWEDCIRSSYVDLLVRKTA